MKKVCINKEAKEYLLKCLNGATNILRKSKQNFDFEELCRGLLASPQRIRLL